MCIYVYKLYIHTVYLSQSYSHSLLYMHKDTHTHNHTVHTHTHTQTHYTHTRTQTHTEREREKNTLHTTHTHTHARTHTCTHARTHTPCLRLKQLLWWHEKLDTNLQLVWRCGASYLQLPQCGVTGIQPSLRPVLPLVPQTKIVAFFYLQLLQNLHTKDRIDSHTSRANISAS